MNIFFYRPNPVVLSYVEKLCSGKFKVLELGPGEIPFSKATHFSAWEYGHDIVNNAVCNFNKDKLPFKDKEFDFVYCRHVIEDLYNPNLILDEMNRVAKAGYIESPNPLAELCINIDLQFPKRTSVPWRGYHHHQWFVWTNKKLCLMKKFPIVEHFTKIHQMQIEKELSTRPEKWNTYYLWENNLDYKIYEPEMDFNIIDNYEDFIDRKVLPESIKSTEEFYKSITLEEK